MLSFYIGHLNQFVSLIFTITLQPFVYHYDSPLWNTVEYIVTASNVSTFDSQPTFSIHQILLSNITVDNSGPYTCGVSPDVNMTIHVEVQGKVAICSPVNLYSLYQKRFSAILQFAIFCES